VDTSVVFLLNFRFRSRVRTTVTTRTAGLAVHLLAGSAPSYAAGVYGDRVRAIRAFDPSSKKLATRGLHQAETRAQSGVADAKSQDDVGLDLVF